MAARSRLETPQALRRPARMDNDPSTVWMDHRFERWRSGYGAQKV
jgi:hypothetical protein